MDTVTLVFLIIAAVLSGYSLFQSLRPGVNLLALAVFLTDLALLLPRLIK